MRQWRHILARARRALLILGVVLSCVGMTSLLNSTASALQITQRSLQLNSAVVSASTTYTYSFVPATSGAIQGIKFQACTTPLSGCTAPSGLSFSGASFGSISGWTNNGTPFTFDGTGQNNCTASASVLCAKRTQAASETNSGVRTISFTGITNPNGTSCATNNCTFFVRITTFSDNTYSTAVDQGTVASSTTQTLTLSATVQENLTFCVGSTTVDDATSAVPLCSAVSGSSLNLGTLGNTNISISPVGSGNNGDSNNGLAEVGTNASNGVAVTYNALQQSGTNHQGTLRVVGASCTSGNSNTDQCINAAGVTHINLTAGAENFGMTAAAVNCSNVTAYTCTFSTGTTDLVRATNYNCDGSNNYPTGDAGLITGSTTCKYAWDETGTNQTIASSSSVVGNEALILKFAATPNLVTPTGSYTAQADFVAIPTY